jgi:hypothetical protein
VLIIDGVARRSESPNETDLGYRWRNRALLTSGIGSYNIANFRVGQRLAGAVG